MMNLRLSTLCAAVCILYYAEIVLSGRPPKRDQPKPALYTKKPSAADKFRNDPDKFLEAFGYITKLPQGVQQDPKARRRGIRAMQKMYGLKMTGEFNPQTIDAMTQKRCGVQDRIPEGQDPLGPQQYYAPGYKWKKNDLKYKVVNYSPDMPKDKQRKAFVDAFKMWSDITPLTFTETKGTDQDIEIKFGSYDHGDGYPFDGQGMVLAHAFFPENGDTHFDESETWSEKGEGTNLMIVAAHEIGHALGLAHSNVQSALMAPTYKGYIPNYQLDYDDILGVQSLYGSGSAQTTTSSPKTTSTTTTGPTGGPTDITTPKPTGKPKTCTTKYDAIFQARDGRIYVFRDKYVFRLHYWGVEKKIKFPQLIRKHFDAPPVNIGAAVYSWKTGFTYLFKGNKVFKYNGSTKIRRKRIKQTNYPLPQAALAGRDGKIYIIKDDKYYIFDETRMRMESTVGQPIQSKWPGVPTSPEAAIRLSDGYLYFFKGQRYHKFDEACNCVLPGYPKDKATAWMGPECSADGQYAYK